MTVEQSVKEIISDMLGIKSESLTDEQRLIEDLGADSLDIVEITMAIEEEFDIDITKEAEAGIVTVKDLIELAQKHAL